MKVVADFWEDHCVECGEPACFRTCPKFMRGPHGRCERIVRRDDGSLSFREWGKIELCWHGRVAELDTAMRLRAWNRKWEPVFMSLQKMLGWIPLPYGKGPYGLFRSLRWRKARRMAEYAERPTRWKFDISAGEPVLMAIEAKSADGNLLVSRTIEAGVAMKSVEVDIPFVEDGALFSIRPANGEAVDSVRIERNELVAEDSGIVKCVAWDLDDTLWRGTLSEGEDVRLCDEVMDVVKKLDELGIVSSICSRNDEEDALAKLKELGVEEWFVFPQINWGPKSESLRRLAEEMNIGLDAIAFVDDREENRNEVKERLPQVRVFSEAGVASLVPRIASAGNAVAPSGALGSSRRRMYREEMKRRMAFKSFGSDAEAFAAASGLEFEMMSVEGNRMVRCRELVQRTNQLNLTARRYDEKAFGELVASTECRAVRVYDRYGDYGIVGFVAWRGTHLVECCFSCRVARRGVERKVLDAVAGGRRFTADVVATERNQPIRDIVKEWLAGGC